MLKKVVIAEPWGEFHKNNMFFLGDLAFSFKKKIGMRGVGFEPTNGLTDRIS
jgi:hypothetical protein